MPSDESTGSNQPEQRRCVISGTAAQAQEVLAWRNWGDNDYVAARRLLLDNLLVQGTALANTALEKYLKAIFAVHQMPIPRSHDPLDLYLRITPRGSLSLDEKFLALLVKAYKLRYPDELKPGFNIVLTQALLLHALDQSVFEIKSHFEFKEPDGNPIIGILDSLLEAKDPRVFIHNTALGTITKELLLGGPSAVFEMRILENGARMEILYVTAVLKEPTFDREGFVQMNDRQFTLTQEPIPHESEAQQARTRPE